jgi:RNA polymerase sigma factor (sigma-70 family)
MHSSAEAPLSPEVVAALVGNHREFLAFLQKRLGDRALAEDILQEAFVRGLDKLGTIENDESATAWFYRVLRNAVIDHHRRRAARDRKLDAFAAELEQHVEPEGDLRGAVCRCVAELASTLKPEYAEALRRVEIDGVAVKDYATEAGISSNNAAVRVFRAREALRKQVSRSCGTCADHGCLDCTCDTSKARCH